MKWIACLLLLLSLNSHAKVLDKIVAVVDDEIISLSEVNRIKENFSARKEFAPFIYPESFKPNQDEIINFLIDTYIIRDELSQRGYSISDQQVESQIKQLEQANNLTRDELLQYLTFKNLSFAEYFRMIKKKFEHSHFISAIISPLVSISEQEIKNEFFNSHSDDKALSYKYNLIGFSISENVLQDKSDNKEFKKVLKTYRVTGSLPELYSDLNTTNFGEITEDGLNDEITSKLKITNEGDFTDPVLLNGRYHSFYIKSKNLVESQSYIDNKEMIRQQLIQKKAERVKDVWLKNQRDKHFIKIFD